MTETNLSTLEEAYNCSGPIVITDLQHPFQIIFANKEFEQKTGIFLQSCKGQSLKSIERVDAERHVLEQLLEEIAYTASASSLNCREDPSAPEEVSLRTYSGSSYGLKLMPIRETVNGDFTHLLGVLQESPNVEEFEETPKKKDKNREKIYVLSGGILLSFNSGYINGCCLSGLLTPSGRSQGVSAFTGTYTKSGLYLADGDYYEFAFEAELILCFILGAFISGVLNPEGKKFELGPSYGPTFLIGSLCLFASCMFAIFDSHNDTLFYFAAMANGIQNGMSSMYTGNLIRSTHLTGTSTDIGLIIGQIVRGNKANSWKCIVLISLALSFWFGGFIGFFATQEFETYSLVFNTVLFFIIGVGCILYLKEANDISLVQAITGNWQWDKVFEAFQMEDGTEVTEEFLVNLFDKIDADGSGEIDDEELFDALTKVGLSNISMDQVQKMVRIADIDGDGQISKEEWMELIQKQKKKQFKRNR